MKLNRMKARYILGWICLFLLGTINVLAQTENRLYIPDVSGMKGSTVVLPICMDNAAEVTALQFTLKMPEGVTLDASSLALTEARKADHLVTVRNPKAENVYTFMAYSPTNQNVKGNSGEVMTIKLHIPETFQEESVHQMELSDVVLSRTDGTNVMTDFQSGTLKVLGTPDLQVENISADKQKVGPGEALVVSWTVNNIGSMPTTAGWSERITLVAADGGYSVLLGTVNYDNTLNAGGVLSRQVEVTLPELVGIGGAAKIQVEVKPYSDAGEPGNVSGNNKVLTDAVLTIDKVLYLEIPQVPVEENTSSLVRCKLSRSGSWQNAEQFTLAKGADARVDVPTTVSISSGQSGAYFYLSMVDNDVLDNDSVVTLSVSGNGYDEVVGRLIVEDNEFPTLTVESSQTEINEGETFQLVVTTERVASVPTTIYLACDHPKRFTYPAQVTMPAGEKQVTVNVVATEDDQPDVTVSAAFTASAAKHNSGEDLVLLYDNDLPEIELVLTPSTISESAGPTAVMATLKRLSHTDNKITVKLSDDSNNRLYYSTKSITFEAGMTEAEFTMGVIDNTLVDGEQEYSVTAAVYISSCSCSPSGTEMGVVSRSLTVLDDDGPALKIETSKSMMLEGAEEATVLTVTRNTDTSEPLTVAITSDYDEGLVYERTVTIPAGAASVKVPVAVKANETSSDDRTVVFSVVATGYTKGTCWVMVTDQTLPDAVVREVLLSDTEVEAGGAAQVTVSVANEGVAVLPSQTKVNLYWGTTSTLLASYYTQEALEPGQVTTMAKYVELPNVTGTYMLRAVINENRSVKELLYVNNTANSASLQMLPQFTATVSTDKSTYQQSDSVIISGKAIGSAVKNTGVEIYIINGGVRQTVTATTDVMGQFSIIWKPYPGQTGHFIVGACYPNEGLETEQASFDIYGLKRSSSGYITCETLAGEDYSGAIGITNPGVLPLTNLNVEVLDVPQNATVEFEPISQLDGGATVNLKFKFINEAPTEGNDWEKVKARVTTTEGATLDLLLYYYCRSPKGELEANISSINTTMIKGMSRDYSFTITNVGKGETGKIMLALPETDWMRLITPKEMATLAYGESSTIVLRLTPTEDMQLNVPFTGKIGINCENGDGLSMDFRIEPVSESTGTLVVDVCDEYTYYTNEGPHVAGAKVVVKHPTTSKIIAEGITGTDGLYRVELPEGYYTISVTADKHDSYTNTVLVDPGREMFQDVFLSFQAITYSWDVVETEVEDEYKVVTTVKYDTKVPTPIVEVLFPEEIPFKNQIIDVVVTNKGLLSAYDVNVYVPTDNEYMQFEVLQELPIAELHAQESRVLQILVKVVDENLFDNSGTVTSGGVIYEDNSASKDVITTNSSLKRGYSANRNSTICVSVRIDVTYEKRICNKETGEWESVGENYVTKTYYYGRCYSNGNGSGVGFPYIYYGGFDFKLPFSIGNPNPNSKPIIYNPEDKGGKAPAQSFDGCTTNCEDARNDAGLGCGLAAASAPGCTAFSYITCIPGLILGCKPPLNITNCLLSGASCVPFLGCITGPASCAKALLDEADICSKNPTISSLSRSKVLLEETKTYNNLVLLCNLDTLLIENVGAIFGDMEWINVSQDEMDKFLDYLIINTDENGYIASVENRYEYKPDNISHHQFDKLIERLNNTFDYNKGITPINENYTDSMIIIRNGDRFIEYDNMAKEMGYEGIIPLYEDFILSLDSIAKAYSAYLQNPSSSVCASITLQFSQTMTMTRQAFRGTLTVFNGHETTAMKDVKLNLEVRDEEGNLATTHEFQINTESLDNFKGELSLNAGWSLAANESGTATILFIPTKYAAPTASRKYSFGGTLSYIDPFTNLEVTRELYPVTLTVNPSPDLDLTYFMQRDIFGDDALTGDVVEPMVPAEFSLLINNKGYGAATNVRMITDQPEIIDNEKGLLIDFELLSSQLNGGEHTLALGGSVATEFGTIPAQSTAYAQWWLQSTLLGHFTEYDIEATHVSSYGNEDLSLLDEVTIHELIHSLKVPGADGTTLAGFLVNDIADAEDMPDMLYLSDATIESVNVTTVANITMKSDTEYLLEVTPTVAGWNYGSIIDPTNGKQNLIGIIRQSDGQEINVRNFWQTDRTLRDGRDPLYENRLHFADKMGTATEQYLLTFAPKPELELAVEAFTGVPSESTVLYKVLETVTVRFNKPIDASTFTTEDLTLNCQGKAMDVSKVVITALGEQEFELNVSELTKDNNGYYVLTVQTAGIEDNEGFNGAAGKQATWIQFADGKVTLKVSASPVDGGTVTPKTGLQDYGTTVALEASPAEGYEFLNWKYGSEVLATVPSCEFRMEGDAEVVATFVRKHYDVTLTYDETAGTVSGGGTGIYDHGTVLTLTAEPLDGYAFAGWNVNGEMADALRTWSDTIRQALVIEALFVEIEEVTVDYDFQKGWNWFSVNVADKNLTTPAVFLAPLGSTANKLMGQNGELTNDPVAGWTGTLETIYPNQGYRLQVNDDITFSIKGEPLGIDGNTITLENGWNWISYRPQTEMSVGEALKNLVATAHDVVKGKASFAMFDGTSWVGSLTTMSPGAGYLMQSHGVKSFNYPASENGTQMYRRMSMSVDVETDGVPESWQYDVHQYEGNTAIVARLYEKDAPAESGMYLVAAFVDGECRGVSVEKNGYLFLTVHGDVENEVISFIAYDPQTGAYSEINETVLSNKEVVGTFETPQRLSIRATQVGAVDGNVCMTCTDKEIRFYGDMSLVTRLDITDMSGKVQLILDGVPANGVVDASGLAAGVYVVTAHTYSGLLQQKFIRR